MLLITSLNMLIYIEEMKYPMLCNRNSVNASSKLVKKYPPIFRDLVISLEISGI